jgi:acetate---CoA ligase (ADP-forming)
MYKKTIEVILQDDAIGSVLVLLTPQTSTECELTAQYLGELQAKYNETCEANGKKKKTFFAAFIGSKSVEKSWKVLSEHKVPNFFEAKHAISALDAMWQYKKWLVKTHDVEMQQNDLSAEQNLTNINKEKVRELLDHIRYDLGHLATGGFEAREACSLYGINFPDSQVVNSAEEAVAAANKIGYPVSLKIASTEILHKSKVGGVKLDVRNEQDVREAYEVMMKKVTTAMPNAKIEGVQVAFFAKDGNADLIVGISRDKQFGPLIMVGIGGVLVESIKDVVFRVAPVTQSMAYEMISEIRSQKLLNKHGPYDVAAAVDTIMRVSRLATDFPEIEEFDINPLIVYGPNEGAVCVDMRLRLSEKDTKKFEK